MDVYGEQRWPEGEGCCEVCLEKECFGNDELFQCELCEGIVHKRCYGGNLLNRGEKKDKTWFCERCYVLTREYLESEKLLGDKTKISRCHFCPDLKGVLKKIAVQLSAVQIWAHIGCITAISTLSFIDSSFSMIVEISKPNRLSDQCSICNQKYGCCGFCHKEGCSFAFHFTCAKRRGLIQGREPTKMLFQATKCFSQQAASRLVYCPEHLFQLSILKMPQDKRIKGMNQQRCLYDQQGQSVSSLYSLDLRRQDDSHRKELIKRFEQFARIRNMKEINFSAAKKKMERSGKPSLIREKTANLTTEKLDQEQNEVNQELSAFESIENWKRVQRVMKNFDFRDLLSKREKFISPIHLLEEIKENLEYSVGENNQLDRDENPIIRIELNEENLQDSYKNQQNNVHQIKDSDEIKEICDNNSHPPENIPLQQGTCDQELNQDNTRNTQILEKNVISSEHCDLQISQETDQSEQKEEQYQSELHSKQDDSKETNIQSVSQEVQIIITPNSSQNSSISNSGTSFKVDISSQMNGKNSPNCEIYQTNTIELTLIEQKTSVGQLEHQSDIDHKQSQTLPMQEEDKMEIEQQEQKTEQKLTNNKLKNSKKLKRIYTRFLKEYVSLNKKNLKNNKSLYILHPAAMLVINIQEAFPLYTWRKEIAYYCVQQECLHPLRNEIQLSKSLNPQFTALWKNRRLPLSVPTRKFFEKFKKYFLVKIYDGKSQTIWRSDQAISCDQDA